MRRNIFNTVPPKWYSVPLIFKGGTVCNHYEINKLINVVYHCTTLLGKSLSFCEKLIPVVCMRFSGAAYMLEKLGGTVVHNNAKYL